MSKITLKLMQHLQRTPTQPVLKEAGTNRWYSGGELAADVDQLKDQLRGLHVGHGNVVLVALPNSAVYPVLLQAIWELGAIAMPVAADITPTGLRALMRQRAFAACVVAPHLLNTAVSALTTVTRLQLNTTPELTLVRDLAVHGHAAATPTEADVALLLTTPQAPERVGLTYAELSADVRTTVADHHLLDGDRLLLIAALNDQDAQLSLLATRLVGGQVVVTTGFTASQFWPLIEENRVPHVALHPQRLTQLLKTLALMSPAGHLDFIPGLAVPRRQSAAVHYRIRQPVVPGSRFINSAKKAIMKGSDATVRSSGNGEISPTVQDTG